MRPHSGRLGEAIPIKFYMMTDLEGVAGVYTWENRDDTSLENHERRIRQRRWLAKEVSAAADGLYAAGATEVIVNDGHGAGYTMDLDHVDPRIDVINGQQRPFWLPYLDETCAATGVVGGHAKAETPSATLCHTMSGAIRNWTFNGVSMGEMGLQAAIAGHFGVPFTLVTGDLHACREMEALIPGVVACPVKIGMSRFSARTMPPERACEAIREAATHALEAIGTVKPLKLDSPITFVDERVEATFDEENPPAHSRVINAHVREIVADDIIDLMGKIYSYDLSWRPTEWS